MKPPLSAFRSDITGGTGDFPVLNENKISEPSLQQPLQETQLPTTEVSPEKQEDMSSWRERNLRGAKGLYKSLSQPFISLAATPVQLGAKAFGLKDPYADFEEKTGLAQPSSIDEPLKKLGEAGEVASYAFPYGQFAKLGTLGRLVGGALGGYGIDVSMGLSEGEGADALKPGFGTALGAAIPGAPLLAKGVGRFTGEALGVTTGTGYGVIRQAYLAGKMGGEQLASFTKALKGRVSPDEIVKESKDALEMIITNRRETYRQQLDDVLEGGLNKSLDISPIVNEVTTQLGKFGIKVKDGVLDFSRSTTRFNKAAQSDVQTIFDEMKGFGTKAGDRTVGEVDKLKQALGDLYSESSKVRAFVAAVKGKTKDVLGKIDGYNELTSSYQESTKLIDEIRRGLSMSDKALVDTNYKKLISALRINNDQRREMIEALEQASGGHLSSTIAGQQMSELLPRGIMRPLGGAMAGGAALVGQILPLLQFAALASPRLVGSTLKTIGFTEAQIQRFMNAIGGIERLQRTVAPATQALPTGRTQPTEQETPKAESQGRPPLESFR